MKILNKVVQLLTAFFLFSLPLFFAPFLADSFDLGKRLFVLGFSILLFILWSVKIVLEKKFTFNKSYYLVITAILFVIFLASSLINTQNRMYSIFSAFGPASMLLILLVFVFVKNLIDRKLALYSLLLSGVVVSIITLVFSAGILTFPINIGSIQIGNAFSPTGSLLIQAIFLIVLIPSALGLAYETLKGESSQVLKILTGVLSLIIIAGFGFSLKTVITSVKPIMLPQTTAWAIAVENLKNVRHAILGLGPGQFINAFTAFKPLSFNSTDLWNLRFSSSSNWYFQLMTEIGLLGLITYLVMTGKIFKDGLRTLRLAKIPFLNLGMYLSIALALIIQFFLPTSFFLFTFVFILLTLLEETKQEEQKVYDLSQIGILVIILLIIPAALLGTFSFFMGKNMLANHYYLKSAVAANLNDGITTYNMQIKAIQTNPNFPTYRISYSQTNLALANGLASKGNLTDEDRTTITQLVQQSIREAKAAVAVDPNSVVAWENLATIYNSLINFAEGANEWTVAAYQQAINLDPLNPSLRVDFGGVYFGQKAYNNAASLFAQAISLKQDYANAHYNLATTLKETGDLVNAKSEYEVVQSLVKIDSNDYQIVAANIEEINKRLPTPTPIKKPLTTETLSTPPTPGPTIKPQLDIPEGGPVTP